MIKFRPAMMLDRLQMVKTEKDKDFRFGRVLLVKEKMLSQKLTPFDVTNNNEPIDGYHKIIAMKLYEEDTQTYREVDVNDIFAVGLRGRGYRVAYLDEE